MANSMLVTVGMLTEILDRIDKSPYGVENPMWDIRKELGSLGKKARSLNRLINLPVPEFADERVRKGLEAMERGEGIDAEEWLAELTKEGA
jgi:hypothetical protein